MTTLKDVAKHAGTSPTTVSIIMNGKAKDRAISPDTVARVMEAVRELNYQPSVSARSLRSADPGAFTVGLFWSSDSRSVFMTRFLEGLEHGARSIREQNINLVIRPYQLGRLEKESSLYKMSSFNAAIIANLSEKDYQYIHKNPVPIPLILVNRPSDTYHAVYIDDFALGRKAALHLKERGVKTAAVLSLPIAYHSQANALKGFLEACRETGITVGREQIIESGISIPEGAEAAEKLLKVCSSSGSTALPDAVFCTTDSIGIGLMRTLNQRGIHVPEDTQVICFSQGKPEHSLYYSPSITILDIPFEQMAERSMDILQKIVRRETEEICTEVVDSVLYQGESTLLIQKSS